jgi:hypothetical protein
MHYWRWSFGGKIFAVDPGSCGMPPKLHEKTFKALHAFRIAPVSKYKLSGVQDHFLSDHIAIRPICFDPTGDGVQCAFQMGLFVGDHGTANHSLLPAILQIHLGHRKIKLTPQTGHQGLNPAALLFKGSAAWQMQMDGERGKHFFASYGGV